MGNKILRPSQEQPLNGFDDNQLSYLAEKFEILSDEKGNLDTEKISQAYQCSKQQAENILKYIDFEGEGLVDFYEFKCAAASLHQDDEQAVQMIYKIYAETGEMTKQNFQQFFGTVFKYLKFIHEIEEQYTAQTGYKKFQKYDYNKNGTISLEQFKTLVKNDFQCRRWLAKLGFANQDPDQKYEKIKEEQFQQQQTTGDQAGSTPAWIKTVQYMAPSQKQKYKQKQLNVTPGHTLQINYIYGYRSYDTRNNLKYNVKGQAVYHTAGTGIVLNQQNNTMKTNTVHNDDITCLDIHKNLVVTGEMGRRPLIAVWDSQTLETIATFNTPLQKSISNIAISKSGKYLGATSMSDNHQIAIYDLQNKKLLCTGNGPRSVIFHIKFNQSQDQLACACSKEIVFANFKQKRLRLEKGIFGKVPVMASYSLANINNSMASGMNNGNILLWKGSSCSKILKQHNSAVTSLCETINDGMISADKDGNIIIWSNTLIIQRKLNLVKLISPKITYNPRIIALANKQSNILVGTRGGEIIEINLAANPATSNIIMQGHYDKQLWALTVSSNKHQILTAGQDKLLIKWDMKKRRMILKKQLEYQVMSIDINNRSNTIAVGFRNGVVGFYQYNTFKTLNKISNHKNPDREVLSIVKFSPDCEILAVGYCPPVSKVYLYNANNFKKIGQCKGSPSRIISVDFSSGGESIMINNTSYQILFYKSTGSQITQATTFRDQKWSTLTCRFSWQTQGIWPPYANGTDIHAIDRSHSLKILATGDNFSKIKLFKYPVCFKRQFFNIYKGHSSHITGVKWAYDDQFLISIGGLQKSIIQWSLQQPKDNNIYEYKEQQQEQQQQENNQQEYQEEQEEILQVEKPPVQEGQFAQVKEEGINALAVKAFQGQVKASTPSDYRMNPAKDDVLPQQSLKLQFAWGIRNQYLTDEVRNQLKYINKGKSCLFITASLGVQMDIKTKNQEFYNVQQEDLISMSITPNKQICATGQMAQVNKKHHLDTRVQIHIWDIKQKRQLKTLTKFHKRAIVLLEFSPNGQQLLSIGQDDKNTLAVYNWKSGNISWSAPTSKGKATAASWKNNRQYVTTGVDHIKFWSQGKGSMGKLNTPWDPMFSVIYVDNKYISGGGSGALYIWNGGVGTKIQGHKNGKVHTLIIDKKKNLYSGGQDGSILYWKIQGSQLIKLNQVVNMTKLTSFHPGVLSLDLSEFEDKLLICTKGSEIHEVIIRKSTQTNCLMKSHYKGQLWTCAFSPDSTSFVSGGDDKSIRIYDLKSKQMKFSFKTANIIRGIDWQNSEGKLIIAGDWKGKIYLFSNQLELLSEGKTKFSRMKPRKSTYWIEDIKFSPNGKFVAFGAHGGASHIQVFNIANNKLQNSFILKVGFTSALLHLDWNKSSDSLVAVSQAYQLKFAKVDPSLNNQNADLKASAMKNQQWATWTCKFGFPVQGIWQSVDYSDINTVCRDFSKKLIATGGDDQLIRLYHYPVTIPKQKNKQYIGHSSHVTRVKFSNNEEYLLSTGGNDRTIILWDVKRPAKLNQIKNEQKEQQQQQQQNKEQDEQDVVSYDENQVDVPRDRRDNQQIEQKSAKDQFQQVTQGGDQFMAVKPWLGAIKQPTQPYYKSQGNPPKGKLMLQYAHGYRTKDCRNNLKYLNQQKISYHTAALGIILDTTTQPKTQQFFDKHSDDILSITWSDDKKYIYTGQLGPKPIIYEYDINCNLIKSYKGQKKGVLALATNQNYLVSASMDDDHNVFVFDKKTSNVVANEKGGKQVILAIAFLNETSFVTIGVKHYKLWQIFGSKLKAAKGLFGKNCNMLCCIAIKQNKIYVGAGDGSLQIWSGSQCASSIKNVHSNKPVDAIVCLDKLLLTGGKDSTIKILTRQPLQIINTINCLQILKGSLCPNIRALDVYQNKILVGTLGSQIYEIQSTKNIEDTTADSQFKFKQQLMSGHFSPNAKWTNQVWGLAIFQDNFITCSDDATIRLWSITDKQIIATQKLDFTFKNNGIQKLKRDTKTGDYLDEAKGRAIGVSHQRWVIVGCKQGTIKIFDDTLKPQNSKKISKKQISDIKFSADNTLCAIGSHDCTIYLFGWDECKLTLKYSMKKHSSYITHLDFSRDGNYIHSTCGAYQLLFWDTNTGKQCTSGASMLKDEKYHTWTTTLGWPVQGIWAQFMDGTDINATDRSKSSYQKGMQLLATGDDLGKVRLFEYPCIKKNSNSLQGRGHSSHVTCVRFTNEDQYIISTGGEDQTVMQWKLQI